MAPEANEAQAWEAWVKPKRACPKPLVPRTLAPLPVLDLNGLRALTPADFSVWCAALLATPSLAAPAKGRKPTAVVLQPAELAQPQDISPLPEELTGIETSEVGVLKLWFERRRLLDQGDAEGAAHATERILSLMEEGGIRGMEELERRVESGECAVAFALWPTSLDEVMNVADADKVMPPKSTWFEPKLRSGMVVQTLEGDAL